MECKRESIFLLLMDIDGRGFGRGVFVSRVYSSVLTKSVYSSDDCPLAGSRVLDDRDRRKIYKLKRTMYFPLVFFFSNHTVFMSLTIQ